MLVTEAGEGSGALITADQALEQNRDVLAVPGSVFSPASSGTNHLIQQGAKLVRNCQDILEELNLQAVAQQLEFKEIIPTSDTEAIITAQIIGGTRRTLTRFAPAAACQCRRLAVH